MGVNLFVPTGTADPAVRLTLPAGAIVPPAALTTTETVVETLVVATLGVNISVEVTMELMFTVVVPATVALPRPVKVHVPAALGVHEI